MYIYIYLLQVGEQMDTDDADTGRDLRGGDDPPPPPAAAAAAATLNLLW